MQAEDARLSDRVMRYEIGRDDNKPAAIRDG